MFTNIITETALASAKGKAFAKVAGASFKDFSEIVRTDTNKALLIFLKGLGKLDKFDFARAMDELGLTDVRLSNAVKVLAGNYDFLNDQLAIADKNIGNTDALMTESEKRFATTKSQLALLGNVLTDVAVTLGMALLPTIIALAAPLGAWVKKNDALIAQVAGALAVGLQAVIGHIGNVTKATFDWITENRPLLEQIAKLAGEVLVGLWTVLTTQIIPAFGKLVAWVRDEVVPRVREFIDTLTKPGGVFESVGKVAGKIFDDLLPSFTGIVNAIFGGDGHRGLLPAIGDLIGTLWGDGNGPLARAIEALAWIWRNVLGPALTFVIDLLTTVIDKAREFIALVPDLVQGIKDFGPVDAIGDIWENITPKGNPELESRINRRAGGGPVVAGVPYLVGEERTEVFIPNQNGRIEPDAGGWGGGGGSGDTYITINHPTGHAAEEDIAFTARRLAGLGLMGSPRPAGSGA
jgi:hypothetical protein